MKFLLIAVLFLIAFASCQKEIVDQCESEKCKKFLDKNWVYDTEAVRSDFMDITAETTGIKNIKKIHLEKDVKGIADALMSKSFHFKWGTGVNQKRLVWEKIEGRGFLETKTMGFWRLAQNDTKLELITQKQGKEEIEVYEIKEINEKKLILLQEGSKLMDYYKVK